MTALILPFVIYWLVMFVASYVIVDVGHDQLYDEPPPWEGLRVLIGSCILAVFLTWLRPSYESMFTSSFAWTALLGIVGFLVFMFVYLFHPAHAAGIGILTMVMIPGVATMGVESMTKPTPTLRPVRSLRQTEPVRRSLAPGGEPAKVAPK